MAADATNNSATGKSFQAIAAAILAEQAGVASRIDEEEVSFFIDAIGQAERVFLHGEGRSGLVMRMFAMRLMHLGLRVHVVGDVTSPSIGQGDLLISCSGSGETDITVILAEKARGTGTSVAAITGETRSRLAGTSTLVVQIAAPHKRRETAASIQYGGTLFEQSALLLCESIVVRLADSGSSQNRFDALAALHTNLE